MGTIQAMGNGLQAAMLLARGRPEGMVLLDAPPEAEATAAARSFWAIALCLPAFLCLHLIDWAESGIPADPAHGFARDLLAYVIGWVGFALLSREITERLGWGRRWYRLVTAWNWCNVIQFLMLVAAALPLLLGLPDFVAETAWVAATGWALWLEWYAIRLALDAPGLAAAGFVAMDLAIGVLLSGIVGSAG
jgi:hypothetical protein